MNLDTSDQQVILLAKRLVTLREPTQGYGDLANTLVDYLRGEINAATAKNILSYLEEVYADDRAKTSKTAELVKAAAKAKQQEHVDQWSR